MTKIFPKDWKLFWSVENCLCCILGTEHSSWTFTIKSMNLSMWSNSANFYSSNYQAVIVQLLWVEHSPQWQFGSLLIMMNVLLQERRLLHSRSDTLACGGAKLSGESLKLPRLNLIIAQIFHLFSKFGLKKCLKQMWTYFYW